MKSPFLAIDESNLVKSILMNFRDFNSLANATDLIILIYYVNRIQIEHHGDKYTKAY